MNTKYTMKANSMYMVIIKDTNSIIHNFYDIDLKDQTLFLVN